MNKRYIFLLIFFCCTQLLIAQTDSVYYGINLSGAEQGNSYYPSTYPTTDILDYYKSKNFTLIRLPISWERIQPTLGGALDSVELGKLISYIDAISNRNMKVIIDIHNYARYNGNIISPITGVFVSYFQDLWVKLASQLKSKTCIWGYDIMNEPHDMTPFVSWRDIAQLAISSIRKVDTNTSIIVGGDSWSSAERWTTYSDSLKTLVDPNNNLIFEAHCYFDNDASGTYKNSYDAEGATISTGVKRVKPFVDWLASNHLKGFVGEYGIPNNDSRWLNVLDTFLVYLKANKIGGAYWDCCLLSCDPVGNVDGVQIPVLVKFTTNNSQIDTATLTLSSHNVNITSNLNSSTSINVISNTSWKASTDQTWLTISPNITIIGNATLQIIASQNFGDARTATITIESNGLTSQTITVVQSSIISLTSSITEDSIFIYPNPATSSFTVSSEDNAIVEIYSTTYQLVRRIKVSSKDCIPLSDFTSGLYIVKIITKNEVAIKNLVIKH
jgi:endoglucanase